MVKINKNTNINFLSITDQIWNNNILNLLIYLISDIRRVTF